MRPEPDHEVDEFRWSRMASRLRQHDPDAHRRIEPLPEGIESWDGPRGAFALFQPGRRFGKNAHLEVNVRMAEARGEWVVVASIRGAHCSRCQREADLCRGTCMNESEPTT